MYVCIDDCTTLIILRHLLMYHSVNDAMIADCKRVLHNSEITAK